MILAFVGGFLVSLYLMLRISYRKVFAAVHAKLPSVDSMKETVSSFKKEVAETTPTKTEAKLEIRKRELEIERERIQKLRDAEKLAEKTPVPAIQHVAIQKKSAGVLSGLFQKGSTISQEEQKIPKTPNF